MKSKASPGWKSEFVTVLEGVSAAGKLLLPFIIDKGKSHIMDWHSYVTEETVAYFAFSDKGWTDNELGLEYLIKVFEPETAAM